MEKVTYVLALGFLFVTSVLKAQEVVSVSKAEVLKVVAGQNISIKISEQNFKEAQADYQQTNAVLMPHISLSYTGMATTNPLMAFGSKLNQEILTSEDFNPVLLNDPARITNYATVIEVRQPLINVDGYYQRKAAANKMRAMELQTTRTRDHMAFEVERSYMQLQLAWKSAEVLQKALVTAEANNKVARDKYGQGYMQKSDLLAVEVRVTDVRNQLSTAQSHIRNTSDYLSFLMGEESNVLLRPSDSLSISTLTSDTIFSVPESRADIRAMQLASEAHAASFRADKMAFLPRLNAFGSYQLYDDQLLQTDASGYIVGAQLSWNILEGTKRIGQVQKSKAAVERSRLSYEQYVSRSNLEMNKARRMLSDAQNKLQLSGQALDQSRESLRIRTNRFREGLEKTADLLAAETRYAQKQLEYYQTVFELNYAQAYIEFLIKE